MGMAYESYEQRSPAPESPVGQPKASDGGGQWAAGFTVLAAVLMIMTGLFQALEGLAAILEPEFYAETSSYAFDLDATAWGWVHLVAGAIVGLAGAIVLTGNLVARIIGITVMLLSAVANFAYVPYYPFWAILIIAVDIVIIWALMAYRGGLRSEFR
jgi:hypothetical protein